MQSSPEANHVTRDMVVDELQSAWAEEQTLRETRRLVLEKLAHASSATSRAVAMALAWGMTTAEIADALEIKPSALHEHLPRRFARKRGWHDAPHLGPGWKRYWNGKSYSRTHVPTPLPRQIDQKRSSPRRCRSHFLSLAWQHSSACSMRLPRLCQTCRHPRGQLHGRSARCSR